MVHRSAPLTETGRLRLARCVVDDGWPVRQAAATGRPHRDPSLDRPPHPGPPPATAAGRTRPGHWRAHPPVRTRPPGHTGPHRRQKLGRIIELCGDLFRWMRS